MNTRHWSPDKKTSSPLPASATSLWINACGLVVALSTVVLLKIANLKIGSLGLSLLFIASYALPIVLLEAVFRKSADKELRKRDKAARMPVDLSRICTKILGFYFILAFFGFCYWVFPEYHRALYDPYFRFLKYLVPILVVGGIPYFVFMDARISDPKDAYWHLGECLFLRWKRADKRAVTQLFLGWLVKAFFLPLMLTGLVGDFSRLGQRDFASGFSSFTDFFNFAFNGLFTIDLLVATTGYLMTFRILDSHIRSTEPTLLGWFVALECYQPFWSFFSHSYFSYEVPNISWLSAFAGNETLIILWGCVILFLMLVYDAASLCFGIRFSNLTHRGILTKGVYSWTKHPSYVSKNLSWWMISVPFLSHAGIGDAVQHCFLLLCVNAIYFFRARTEERHLSKDPVYVEYALAMNERSLFRWLGRLIPYFRYDPRRYESR